MPIDGGSGGIDRRREQQETQETSGAGRRDLDAELERDAENYRKYSRLAGMPKEKLRGTLRSELSDDVRWGDLDESHRKRFEAAAALQGKDPQEVFDQYMGRAPSESRSQTAGSGGESEDWSGRQRSEQQQQQRSDDQESFPADPAERTDGQNIEFVKWAPGRLKGLKQILDNPPANVPEELMQQLQADYDKLDQNYNATIAELRWRSVPRDPDGNPDVTSYEYADWYQQQGDTGDRPAPKSPDPEITELPPYEKKPGGTFGRLTDTQGNVLAEFRSGYGPPGNAVDVPELHRSLRSHVEAHGSAWMRENGLTEGVLYINRPMCPNDAPLDHPSRDPSWKGSCSVQLPNWLPDDGKITVYDPDGWHVRRGRSTGDD